MLKINTYSVKGTKLSLVALPKDLEAAQNPRLIAQAIRVYEDKAHIGLARTKTRAEVNRTKKKVYKQKGTGGARHGSRSAPIYVGGGVAHGPKGIKRELNLPEKLKRKALASVISLKVKKGETIALDDISKLTKTKEAKLLTDKFAKIVDGVRKFTFVLDEKRVGTKKILRNLKNVNAVEFKNLNAHTAFFGGLLIFDRDIFKTK